MKEQKLVEIVRSFSYKVNKGNFGDGLTDFFCSQKAECFEKDAEKVSEAVYEFCKREVMKSVNAWLREKGYSEIGIPPKVEYTPKKPTKGFSNNGDSERIIEKLKTHGKYLTHTKDKDGNTIEVWSDKPPFESIIH